MSIRSKILLPMVIISILATSTILFSNIMQFSSFVNNYIESELERAVFKTIDEIEGLKAKSRTAVLYYANDKTLISTMESGNQEAVLKRAEELYAQTEVGSLTVVDADAIVLARGHNPTLYGDDTSHMNMVQSTLAGRQILGAARGISTDISVRASSPVYDGQGRLLGALFAGDRLDTEAFVDRLKAFTGCEISVFMDDTRIATTLYNESGTRATDVLIPGYIEKALLAGQKTVRQTGLHGFEIMKKYAAIFNSENEIIGIVAVGKYLNEKQTMVTSFIATGFLITVIFITGSILIILFVSRQIAAPINQSIDQARFDDLTGIFNRRSFEGKLNLLLKTLSRSGGTVSLMMIDIDFFKRYNDTYGHIMGDDCLKSVVAVLTQSIARTDDFVARYGGEEFVAVLPNTNEEGARAIAEKLLEGVRNCCIPHAKSDVSDRVTISIGVTTGCADPSLNGKDFIRQADSMLYESKRNGRNMYTFAPMR